MPSGLAMQVATRPGAGGGCSRSGGVVPRAWRRVARVVSCGRRPRSRKAALPPAGRPRAASTAATRP
eukprot:8946042-Lingulodinium_polyedra.AAC.1